MLNPESLKCKCGCGMDVSEDIKDFLLFLDEHTDMEININSGARCEAHNKAARGSENSAHCKGLAVGIDCKDIKWRGELIGIIYDYHKAYMQVDLIEICDKHIHVTISEISLCERYPLIEWGVSK